MLFVLICESSKGGSLQLLFFSLSSPFLIRQLMKWPLFSTLPPPMSHCFVSKNRHSLEERARGYTAPFSEAPRIWLRPVRVWRTRRKEISFFLEKRKNLVENKQDLFFPSVLQGKEIHYQTFKQKFLPSSEENCLTLILGWTTSPTHQQCKSS